MAEHMRALIHLNLLEFDKAEALLQTLGKKLLARAAPDALSLLGEVYAATGSIHLLKSQEDFGWYYQKALSYLPEGSNFHNRKQMSTRNNHSFFLPDSLPGTKKRMERAMHRWIHEREGTYFFSRSRLLFL